MRYLKVNFFAGLSEYFGKEMTLSIEDDANGWQLIEHLITTQAEAADLLKSSKLATDSSFLEPGKSLVGLQEIFVLPPSSGG